jgi:hypothetical protein
MVSTHITEPPTRPQTMHDGVVPPPQGRANHPFAYDPGQSIPFAAFSGEQHHPEAIHSSGGRQPTRESEVMSRGAGLGRPPTLGPVVGLDNGPDPAGQQHSHIEVRHSFTIALVPS